VDVDVPASRPASSPEGTVPQKRTYEAIADEAPAGADPSIERAANDLHDDEPTKEEPQRDTPEFGPLLMPHEPLVATDENRPAKDAATAPTVPVAEAQAPVNAEVPASGPAPSTEEASAQKCTDEAIADGTPAGSDPPVGGAAHDPGDFEPTDVELQGDIPLVASESEFYDLIRARFGIDMSLDPLRASELAALALRGRTGSGAASAPQLRFAGPSRTTDEAKSGRPPPVDRSPPGAVRAPPGRM
jgi:hypothetical protein